MALYVIGVNEYDFIKVGGIMVPSNSKEYIGLNDYITNVYYEVSVEQASKYFSWQDAENHLIQIKQNIENIQFNNDNVIGNVIDKENGFDKFSYANSLKIYNLVPKLVE